MNLGVAIATLVPTKFLFIRKDGISVRRHGGRESARPALKAVIA